MFLQTLPTPGPHLEVHNATKLLLLLLLLSLLLSLLLLSLLLLSLLLLLPTGLSPLAGALWLQPSAAPSFDVDSEQTR